MILKCKLLTLIAEPDSSKLERKPCVRNGLNSSGPDVSRLHVSQSLDETSDIADTMETDIILGVSRLVGSP